MPASAIHRRLEPGQIFATREIQALGGLVAVPDRDRLIHLQFGALLAVLSAISICTPLRNGMTKSRLPVFWKS